MVIPRDVKNRFRGRGAVSNPTGRFEPRAHESFDDGWTQPVEPESDEPPRLDTTVIPEQTREAISRNDSPDIGFDRSINPYKGCEHGCVYCLSPDTPILMGDGQTKPLRDAARGDEIYGTVREGWYRRYVRTRVLDLWQTRKPAFRVTLEDETTLVASGDHRFLTSRGWKFVDGRGGGPLQRAHLTLNDKLMGVGQFAPPPPTSDESYRRGYLCGLIRGDGHLGSYVYDGKRRERDVQHRFRLALIDQEPLDRASLYLAQQGIETFAFRFAEAVGGRRPLNAIRSSAGASVRAVAAITAWPCERTPAWSKGFLAGIFDAEGSLSAGVLRISNTDDAIVDELTAALRTFGFRFVVELPARQVGKPIKVVRLLGGLQEQLRFLHLTGSAIARKRDIAGASLKSAAKLRVVGIEPAGTQDLIDITTGTGDFIADGVVSHNCFARPSHSYLGLSPGLDFETKIFSKPDAPEKLREALSKPSYRPDVIVLGANTDPYQPVERELGISRRILEVLRDFRHPVGILTKSALVLRDLDVLAEMARDELVQVYVSVTTLDRELWRVMEPRAARPDRRVDTIRELNAAGVPASVLAAPMIPKINDHELEHILEACAAAGATNAGYVLLRLPHELKELFTDWLQSNFPLRAEHVLSTVRDTRGGKLYDSRWGVRGRGTGPYAQLLEKRFELACKRLGLNQARRVLAVDKFRVPPKAGDQLTLF